ncbi:MAG: ABC transporter permease subunit [Desulfuromonadales bacterium]|nr:ABC transporter permease subunit [Desulfuromonadales bacterium]
MAEKKKITGTQRRYTTKKSIKYMDVAATVLISLGGLGTIIAVAGVFIFLASVVVPLFAPAEMTPAQKISTIEAKTKQAPLLIVDEFQLSAWTLEDAGASARAFVLNDGETLLQTPVFAEETPQAWAYDSLSETLIAAFADGRIELKKIGFRTRFLLDEQVLPGFLQEMEVGSALPWDEGIVQRTPIGQLRQLKLELESEALVATEHEGIRLISMINTNSGPVLTYLTQDGVLRIQRMVSRRNLLTGQVTTTVTGGSLQLDLDRRGLPQWLELSGRGDTAFLAWSDGHLLRIDSRNFNALAVAEELSLIPDGNATLTSLSFLIGRTTLVAGDSQGRLNAWFRTRPEGTATSDGSRLTLVHDLGQGPAAVTALAPSTRSRLLAAGFADGTVRTYHVTSDQLLVEERAGQGAVAAVALAPRDNLLAALVPSGLMGWYLDNKHPTATWHTLFGKVHYEGMNEPGYVWQSTGGTDDFEPKYSLIPLIYGTLKATFFSMFFGVPLALLAAVYTSEFLEDKRVKAQVKPLVELMESLPTVVLGFLAALVFAVFVEGQTASVLAAFITVPLSFVAAAYLFLLLPIDKFVRFSRFRFYIIALLALPIGILLARQLGSVLEALLFAGDIKAWLDGQVGTGTGGWFLLLLPLSSFVVALFYGLTVNPWLRNRTAGLTRFATGMTEIVKFACGVVIVTAMSWLAASLLTAAGIDIRSDFPFTGQIMGTYVQRNALVVGFVMGFAIIPAVYTIAEDALSSVPEHLRSGSLSAGASPWQTAIRIIIPTAASGLFSAVMLGLGRAVGETMIVLMATGNTPVMEMNIFNGFRTLSANIAVELPEAIIYGTHFRILFLAALTLFLLTFTINTIAEVIRQRFRKRAFQL